MILQAPIRHSSLSKSVRPAYRAALAVGLLLLGSGWTHALTVGNIRGAALIGKPVNVTIPVALEPGEKAASTCFDVEIHFGDSRLDGGRVRSAWVNPEATADASLRVQSTQVIDEPVVGIWVRAGCTRKVERRFVLLADVVAEPAPAGPASAEELALTGGPVVRQFGSTSISGVVEGLGGGSASRRDESAVALQNKAAPTASAVASAPVARVRRAPAASVAGDSDVPVVPKAPMVKPAKPDSVLPEARISSPPAISVVRKPAGGRATLRLEGLPEVQPTLKATLDLTVVPSENLQAREDARALWRALNMQADDLQRDARRLQSLESQVKAAQAQQSKEQAELAALRAQLEQAEEERYANWLVGLLAALLLAVSGGAMFLWWRTRKTSTDRAWSPRDWWHGNSVEPSNLSDLAPVDGGASRGRGRSEKGGLFNRSTKKAQLDSVLGGNEPSIFDSLKMSVRDSLQMSSRPDSIPPVNRAFVNSMSARTVNVEELFDIQQQADFFVSLGQHEQAIELLRQHIYTNSSTSGMAYLDLLQIYHKFGRRQEYDQLREEFNRLFNAQVPPFEKFGQQQRRGLERYPSAMARIEAMWKSPRILSVLQESVFRRPEAGDAECFDLEAYRELLLLFAIAKEVVGESPGVTPVGHDHKAEVDAADWAQPAKPADSLTEQPFRTSVQSRTDAMPDFRTPPPPQFGVSITSHVDDIPLPKPSPRLGVDVNLFELESSFGEEPSVQPQEEFRVSSFTHGATSEFGAVAPPDIGRYVDVGSPPAPTFDLDISEPAESSSGAAPATKAQSAIGEEDSTASSLPPLDFSLSLPDGLAAEGASKISGVAETGSIEGDLKKFIAQKSSRNS